MKLNENIKNFRMFRGIKQQTLAEMLHKSKSVISNWERGENSPDLDSCEQLCKILKVTPNQLFGWEDNPEYLEYLKKSKENQARISELRTKISELQSELMSLEAMEYDPLFDFLDDSADDDDL